MGSPSDPPLGSPLSPEFSRTSTARSDVDSDKASRHSTAASKSKGKPGKGRFLTQLKDWMSTSEPSSQALKQLKLDTFRTTGISTKDPAANAKLHAPIGEIPSDATQATRGPDPEEVARKQAEQNRKFRQSHANFKQGSRSSQSHSSNSGSASSVRENTYFSFDKPLPGPDNGR